MKLIIAYELAARTESELEGLHDCATVVLT